MKRVLLLLITSCLVSLTGYSQKLGFKTDNAERIYMGTNYVVEKNIGIATEYSLNKKTKEEQWGVLMIVPHNIKDFSFDEGSVLLVRTFSGSVVQLVQYLDRYEVELKTETRFKTHTAYPRYLVKTPDFDTIIKEGVKKMRFDSTAGFIDFEFPEDYMGAILAKQRSIIIEESNLGRSF